MDIVDSGRSQKQKDRKAKTAAKHINKAGQCVFRPPVGHFGRCGPLGGSGRAPYSMGRSRRPVGLTRICDLLAHTAQPVRAAASVYVRAVGPDRQPDGAIPGFVSHGCFGRPCWVARPRATGNCHLAHPPAGPHPATVRYDPSACPARPANPPPIRPARRPQLIVHIGRLFARPASRYTRLARLTGRSPGRVSRSFVGARSAAAPAKRRLTLHPPPGRATRPTRPNLCCPPGRSV